MTDEIRNLLSAIRGPHVAKKRATVIRLAFARANQQPMHAVFGQEDTCAANIWYMKWRFNPSIAAAFEACYERAMAWRDEETAQIEAYYRQERLRAIAELSSRAPQALASVMENQEISGGHRISAADRLIQLADPELAGKLGSPAMGSEQGGQVVNVFSGWTDQELDHLIENLEAAEGSGATGATTATNDGA